jgi:hypothetical protein
MGAGGTPIGDITGALDGAAFSGSCCGADSVGFLAPGAIEVDIVGLGGCGAGSEGFSAGAGML